MLLYQYETMLANLFSKELDENQYHSWKDFLLQTRLEDYYYGLIFFTHLIMGHLMFSSGESPLRIKLTQSEAVDLEGEAESFK